MPKESRASVLRDRFRILFPASSAPLPQSPRKSRVWTDSKPFRDDGHGAAAYGRAEDRAGWLRKFPARNPLALAPRRIKRTSPLTLIAAQPDEPIPGCRHTLPVHAAAMAKSKKKPKPDYAQTALANLLKATGAKTLVEPKVVKMPKPGAPISRR